jgi:hypothetical protein
MEFRAFAKSDNQGYTQDVAQAGQFSLEEAAVICKKANHALGISTDFPEMMIVPTPEKEDVF